MFSRSAAERMRFFNDNSSIVRPCNWFLSQRRRRLARLFENKEQKKKEKDLKRLMETFRREVGLLNVLISSSFQAEH